jgi:hypothetical protein
VIPLDVGEDEHDDSSAVFFLPLLVFPLLLLRVEEEEVEEDEARTGESGRRFDDEERDLDEDEDEEEEEEEEEEIAKLDMPRALSPLIDRTFFFFTLEPRERPSVIGMGVFGFGVWCI